MRRISSRGRDIPAWSDIRHVGETRDLAARGFGDVNVRVVEQQACGAIEFDARLFIRRFGGNQIRLGGSQDGSVLQDRSCGGESDFQLLLIGVERLAGKIDRILRRLHGSAVLSYVKLRVPHFDPHLILQLVQAYLGLTIFQFCTHLIGLRFAIPQRNVEGESNAFIGRCGVDELVQRSTVTDWTAIGKGRWRAGAAKAV